MFSFLFSVIVLFGLFSTKSFAAQIAVNGGQFEESLNQAIDRAQPGDIIKLPEGKFDLSNEILINKGSIAIQGQGPKKTILSFKNQKSGPQGILISKDQVVLEKFAVEDTAGNGIKAVGAKGLIFNDLRVEWTNGPATQNGSYGLYPVLSQDVVINNCEVIGASDAGVYVGQSRNIKVNNNFVHHNVAGIEIENSSDADVSRNLAENNTAGILVFNLPDLLIKNGKNIRVFENKSQNNNLKNFSTAGSIINMMPAGVGFFALAGQGIEVFENHFKNNHLSGVAIANYMLSGRKIMDSAFDPMPKAIFIHDNIISKPKIAISDMNKMTVVIKLIFGLKTPSIIYDGIDDGTYNGEKPSKRDQICIYNNFDDEGHSSSFGNLHLDHQRSYVPFPGGPGTRDIEKHFCKHDSLQSVSVPGWSPGHDVVYVPSESEILKACRAPVLAGNINTAALNYNCPELSQYNLFKDASDATRNPNGNGMLFKPVNELFTDYAEKSRFVFLPAGESMVYQDAAAFEFPVGSVITKNFSVYEFEGSQTLLRPVETRLLIKRKEGWVPLNYIWDAQGKKAYLKYGGYVQTMRIKPHGDGVPVQINYQVPNLRQCTSCHHVNDQIQPLGIKAKFLNWNYLGENQLVQFEKKGLLKNKPELNKIPKMVSWEDVTAPIEKRAQGYLDINCSHCHNPVGNARNTGLYLNYELNPNSRQYGVCKTPVAAGIGSGGHPFAIQPGSATDSVLYYRMSQDHLAVKMPQLGRSVTHVEAMRVIKSWIDQMPKTKCTTN